MSAMAMVPPPEHNTDIEPLEVFHRSERPRKGTAKFVHDDDVSFCPLT